VIVPEKMRYFVLISLKIRGSVLSVLTVGVTEATVVPPPGLFVLLIESQ
jgi:hypothetical protein